MNGDPTTTLRQEIAILQEEVNKYKPGSAQFSIPALAIGTTNTITKINKRLINKNSKTTLSTINISNTITLDIPKEYTRYFNKKIIPIGTRFIVGFVGGDISSARIIGRFDKG